MQDKERLFAFVPGVARKTGTVDEAMSCYVPKIIPIKNVPIPFFQTQLDELCGNQNFVVVRESQLLNNTKKRSQSQEIEECDAMTFSTKSPAFFEVKLKTDKTFCEDEGKAYAKINADEIDVSSESIVVLHGFQRRV